jgi:hypothetical protein
MGRFNYWSYECARPKATKDPPEPSAGRIAHAKVLKTFQQIRDDVETAQRPRPRMEAALMRMGIAYPTPAIRALGYYLTTDRLWSQNGEAWTLLRQQPPEVQHALRTWACGVWRRRTPWSWDELLRAIARDQAVFQEIHDLGPTQAGLVDSRWQDGPPIWKKYGVSKADAHRVYCAYHRKMSELLGHGVTVSKVVCAAFRARGIEVRHIRPTRVIAGLSEVQPDEQIPIILHWFAHALRNLARYRHGHEPLPWHLTACLGRCLQVQRDLRA